MELETAENQETESQELKTKKSRHRKKQIYNAIRKQMEFYFGEANLSKDRFLGEMVNSNNGEVPIAVFLTFNKIKNLTDNEKDIANSISNSELLVLSEDNLKVKRKVPMSLKSTEEIENCTLYFENIPLTDKVNHEWVINLFQKYGKVNYVSLPKYKKSGKIKGFGFVEFDSPDSVEKAIQTYSEFNGVLKYSVLEAEKLMSISTFQKEADESSKKDEVPASEAVDDNSNAEEPPTKKLKITSDVADEIVEPPNDLPEESTNSETTENLKEDENLDAEDTNEEGATTEEEDPKGEENPEKPKKKRRKHKKKSTQKVFRGFHDEKIHEIRIMRKKDWRKMRNAYLEQERKKAKEIKKILMENRKNLLKSKSPKKPTTSPGNINFYGSPKDVDSGKTSEQKKKQLTFEPGLIVKIKFREPIVDVKELKTELKQYSYVKYIDVTEGDFECHVRVETPAFSSELVNQYSSCEYETEVLSDEVEKEYWNKINLQREQKLHGKDVNKNIKPKKKRGREKLLKKITKCAEHIRFDAEEDSVE